MLKISDCFLTLELKSCESSAELKTAYYIQAKKWHPDKYSGDAPMIVIATEKMKCINIAFEHLSELFDKGLLPNKSSNIHNTETKTTYKTQHTYKEKIFTPGFPDNKITEVFVKSSHIISVGYDKIREILYIKFDSNAIYSYFNFPESKFFEFIDSESKGKFANAYIYKKYEYKQIYFSI